MPFKIDQATVQGILRHLLSFGGGLLVAKGHASVDQVASLTNVITDPQTIGAALTIIAIVKSYFHKTEVAAQVSTLTGALNSVAAVQAGLGPK